MFKSLTIYQLTQATDAILKRLPAALESLPFAECTDHQVKSRGFVPPLGFGEITYSANGGTLFRLRTDVKELPAGAIKLMVQEQIADRAGDDSFDPDNKTDVRLLKDEITQKLLPGCVGAPSWQESRRLAGGQFEATTQLLATDPTVFSNTIIENQEQVLRWIDTYMDNLTAWRNLIVQGDSEAIDKAFSTAMTLRDIWLRGRETGRWEDADAAPTKPSMLMTMMGFGRMAERRQEEQRREEKQRESDIRP